MIAAVPRVEIYSKKDCPWCEKAKKLFDNLGMGYTEYVLNEHYTKKELQEKIPGVSTVPQIYINQKLVGGYTELTTYLEESLSHYAHDI